MSYGLGWKYRLGREHEVRVKTGKQHTESLDDGRCVYLDGKRIDDVSTSAAFSGIVGTIEKYYDFAASPDNAELMTTGAPEGGGTTNRMWDRPTSYESLLERRRALEAFAELSHGFVGRSPDHVASMLVGMTMGLDVFKDHSPERADALQAYFEFARRNDIYIAYTIINPQANKTATAADQPNQNLVARIVDEDTDGILINGAKMLGTAAVVANELFIGNIQPLKPGDEDYAFTAAIPMSAPGLKLLSRRSYELGVTTAEDYPLSSRFDENDALVFFENVKIPWERVFLARDIQMAQAQWHKTQAHVYQNHQCLVRLTVKLKFLAGLAYRMAEVNSTIVFAQVRDQLGELAAQVSQIEAMVSGAEASGQMVGKYYSINRRLLCAAQSIAQKTYPRVIECLRTLAGGGMIMLPSSANDLENPELLKLIEQTQQSAVVDADTRVRLFKLAWDAVGSEFASRHLQYEMFYSGSSTVLNSQNFRNFDWDQSLSMIESYLTRTYS